MGATSTEQYCLRWNDFQSNITGAFSDIRDDEDFLDVTLVSDGQTIKAHKLVLSACSPLFRSMLKKNTHPQPMIFLHGVRYSDISAILNFMYHGEVNVNQEDLQTFLAAAEELRIRGLSDRSAMEGGSREGVKGNDREGEDSATTPPSNKRHRQIMSSDLVHRRNSHSPNRAKSPMQQQQRRRRSSGGVDDPKMKKKMVITPDMPPGATSGADYQDNSCSSQSGVGAEGFGANYAYDDNLYHGRPGGKIKEAGSPNGVSGSSSLEPPFWSTFGPSSMASILEQQQFLHQQHSSRSTCPYCQKELKNAHSLNVHISRYHTEGSQSGVEVICPVCERKYGNKYSLRTHMHLNHKDQLHLLGSARRGRRPVDQEQEQEQEQQQQQQNNSRKEGEQDDKEEGYYY